MNADLLRCALVALSKEGSPGFERVLEGASSLDVSFLLGYGTDNHLFADISTTIGGRPEMILYWRGEELLAKMQNEERWQRAIVIARAAHVESVEGVLRALEMLVQRDLDAASASAQQFIYPRMDLRHVGSPVLREESGELPAAAEVVKEDSRRWNAMGDRRSVAEQLRGVEIVCHDLLRRVGTVEFNKQHISIMDRIRRLEEIVLADPVDGGKNV